MDWHIFANTYKLASQIMDAIRKGLICMNSSQCLCFFVGWWSYAACNSNKLSWICKPVYDSLWLIKKHDYEDDALGHV